MTVELQDDALFLGGPSGLNLLMTEADPVIGARIHALGDDMDLGTAEAVIASITSQLQDGDLERLDRFGNREASIPLVIDAPGSATPGEAIAQMQAELDAACRFDGWTELIYTSPLAGAEPSVFEVTSATVSAKVDDLAEVTQGCRYVTLSIHARPFVRTLDPVTIDAPPVPGSTPPADVTLDAGNTVSGWSAAGIPTSTNSIVLGASDPVFAGQVVGFSKRTSGSSVSQPWVSANRTLSIPVDSTRPFLLITGNVRYRHDATLSMGSAGTITVSATGASSSPVTVVNLTHNATTGAYSVLLKQNSAVSSIKVKYQTPSAFRVSLFTLWAGVDSIKRTVGAIPGVFTGKVQSRQVQIYGSQRTELSLAVDGLDTAGTVAVGLGEQVLVYTASAGLDVSAKFVSCRAAPGNAGTVDTSAVSGVFSPLSTTSSPVAFVFAASTLSPGTYMAVARVRSGSAGTSDLSIRASLDLARGDNIFEPRTGWRTAPLTVVASGAVWPNVNVGQWVMVPLGLLRLPPADLEDGFASIAIQVAGGSLPVDLDDVFLVNTDVGQTSLVLTGFSSGQFSAVRLDAATVDAPQASAWVGAVNAEMFADPARWIGEQHAAAPGLLQIATVTPGCATSRVSASYFPRFHTHVASIESA